MARSDSIDDLPLGIDASVAAHRLGTLVGLRASSGSVNGPPSLPGRDYRGADLTSADLSECWLKKYDLRRAILRLATLDGAHLLAVDLRHADLQGASLRRATIAACDLRHADLRHADLRNVSFGARHTKDGLQGTTLMYAQLEGCRMNGATFEPGTEWPDGFDPEQAGARLI